jgi:hypothetical protein
LLVDRFLLEEWEEVNPQQLTEAITMVLFRSNTRPLVAACVLLPLHVSKTICLYVLMACAKNARLAPAEMLHVALFWGLTGGGGWPLVHGCLAVVNFEVLGPWRIMLKVSSRMQCSLGARAE